MLCDVIESRFDEVIERWRRQVTPMVAPNETAVIELVDHMPHFVRDLVETLRSSSVPRRAARESAARHGSERLRLGFSVEAVVREYGMLREAITATAVEAQYRPTLDEVEQVANTVIEGIAVAVSEYARQRDAELARQHNEHIAFLAHELRNPLSTAVMAHTSMRAGLDDTKVSSALARSLATMQSVIDGALHLAQFGATIEVARAQFSLRALLDEVQAASEPDASAAKISLAVELDGDIELNADRRLLRSALDNLVRNAVKYSRDGGTVTIRGRAEADRVQIEVADACGGLPPGAKDELFAPFVRRSTKKSGFGLGLAIAKQAIDAHGGSIQVRDVPGDGCIFVIDLPRGI